MEHKTSLELEHIQYVNKCTEQNEQHNTIHCHDTYEVYYFLSGDVEVTVEGEYFKPKGKSIVLIAPYFYHSIKCLGQEPYHRIQLHFDEKMADMNIMETLISPFYERNVMIPVPENGMIDHCFEALEECVDLEEEVQNIAFSARTISVLSQIFAMSVKNKERKAEISEEEAKILSYVNAHLKEQLTLEEIAGQFYISKNHLTSIFKKITGTTVANYITHKRVALAKAYIAKGEPLTNVAYLAGFNDYSSFFRSYKKICGHAPSEGRADYL